MNTETKLDLVTRVRELISDPARWTQHFFGRRDDGTAVNIDHIGEATCFCMRGAARKVALDLDLSPDDADNRFMSIMRGETGCIDEPVTVYNDTHEHAEVLAKLDCAIDFLKDKSA